MTNTSYICGSNGEVVAKGEALDICGNSGEVVTKGEALDICGSSGEVVAKGEALDICGSSGYMVIKGEALDMCGSSGEVVANCETLDICGSIDVEDLLLITKGLSGKNANFLKDMDAVKCVCPCSLDKLFFKSGWIIFVCKMHQTF